MKLYRRKGSKSWWLSYNVNGRRFRESTGTHRKQQAEAFMAQRQVEIFEGRHFPNKRRMDLTIVELRDKWLAHKAGKKSIRDDKQRFSVIVDHFGASTRIAALFAEDIATLRAELQKRPGRGDKPAKPATVKSPPRPAPLRPPAGNGGWVSAPGPHLSV